MYFTQLIFNNLSTFFAGHLSEPNSISLASSLAILPSLKESTFFQSEFLF